MCFFNQYANLFTIIKDIFTVLAIIVAGLGVFIHQKLTKRINLRIKPKWIDKEEKHLKIRLELENISKVRVRKPTIFIQILEYKKHLHYLSEWVPFEIKFENDKCDNRLPETKAKLVEFKEPEEICKSTKYLESKSIITVERISYHPNDVFVHIALQVRGKKNKDRWTTTCIVTKKNFSN